MAHKPSQSRSEVDVLWDRLPQVFQLVDLPPGWDDDWITIPVDSPESNLDNGPDEELFAGDGTFFEQNTSIINTSETLPEELAGKFPGALNKSETSMYPPADALAFYLPFHYFYPMWWGVYLLAEGVQALARILYQLTSGRVTASDCRTAARIFLFGHEQYHHSIESFATRLEITHRRPVYKTGFESFYQRTRDTIDWLEEALANANGFRRVKLSFEKGPAQESILAALLLYIQGSGPGYNRGTDYISNSAFEAGGILLAEAGHKSSSLGTPDVDPELWMAFAHSFHPFRKRGSHVVYLVHRNSPLSRRAGLGGRYARYRDVIKGLKKFGCTFVREGSGSHEIWRGPNERCFPVPRHRGDLKRGTLSGILGQAGITIGVEEFLQRGN